MPETRKAGRRFTWPSVNDLPRMVELLVNKGADVNPKVGPSPLVGAVMDGHTHVVRVLLDKKVLVHGPPGAATTPLHLAAEKGYPDIVRLLLEKKATPNRKDSKGNTPLYYAIYNDHFHVIQELVDNGVNVNQKTPEGHSSALGGPKGTCRCGQRPDSKRRQVGVAKFSRGKNLWMWLSTTDIKMLQI